ncbi:hypothetical protein FF38_11425 [Lucilia cuprina]|uniref:Uncharacterized protein n=1 Tax=Lucilia cuprina TaxID=7375 RepID=A0A0L0CBU3_LUCCU|nr:hypothetical protein FF38_11425 [Lucilia cuprina]
MKRQMQRTQETIFCCCSNLARSLAALLAGWLADCHSLSYEAVAVSNCCCDSNCMKAKLKKLHIHTDTNPHSHKFTIEYWHDGQVEQWCRSRNKHWLARRQAGSKQPTKSTPHNRTEIKKISSFREHRCNVLLTATGRTFVLPIFLLLRYKNFRE